MVNSIEKGMWLCEGFYKLKTSLLDRLGYMLLADAFHSLQIGDGPRHRQDARVDSGREAELLGHHLTLRNFTRGLRVASGGYQRKFVFRVLRWSQERTKR